MSIRFIFSIGIGALAISCAAAPQPVVEPDPPAPLARFMREQVSVPFSFAMLETAKSPHGHRVYRAATVLHDAAHDLVQWSDPPAASEEGREVFYAYAHNLEHQVGRLEVAAADRDAELAADSLEGIRQTCNSCHHYFRPASRISPDVAYDQYVLDRGVEP